jgi:hypothetical protein
MKADSIWVQLSSGFNCIKYAYWLEVFTGLLAYPAVSLGRMRKKWWMKETQELVLYRDENNKCHVEWIDKSKLLFRYLDYERRTGRTGS